MPASKPLRELLDEINGEIMIRVSSQLGQRIVAALRRAMAIEEAARAVAIDAERCQNPGRCQNCERNLLRLRAALAIEVPDGK